MSDKDTKPIRMGSGGLITVRRRPDGRLYFEYRSSDGKRHQRSSATRKGIVEAAKKVEIKLSTAADSLKAMTSADALELSRARQLLKSAGISGAVDGVIGKVAEMVELTGSIERLEEVAGWAGQSKGSELAGSTIAEMVEAMLKAKTAADRSEIHVRTLGGDLRIFVRDVGQKHPKWPGPINKADEGFEWPQFKLGDISAGDIENWLAGRNVGSRRKLNLRDNVAALYRWARKRDALPPGITPAESVEKPSTSRRPPKAYTPDEIRKLLDVAVSGLWYWGGKKGSHPHAAEHVLIIALRAFAGIRLAEVCRLKPADIRIKQQRIVVDAEDAKASGRSISIRPNLLEWLKCYPLPLEGFSVTDEEFPKLFAKMAKSAGVKLIKNGLRDSFISYRVAQINEIAQVAYEAGNSVGEIRASYLDTATEDPEKYFAIMPDATGVVVAGKFG